MGYKNDIISIKNCNYKIIEVNETWLVIDNYQLTNKSNNISKNVNSKSISKINQVFLNYSTISTIDSNKSITNDSIFINNSIRYKIYFNYTSLFGDSIHLSKSIYENYFNFNNGEINVCLNNKNSLIKSLSNAFKFIDNFNKIYKSDKYHFIKLSDGYLYENNGLQFQKNCLINGMGIDKTY